MAARRRCSVILAGLPTVHPLAGTRCRPRVAAGAAAATSHYPSGAVPTAVRSPPGLPSSVPHELVRCRGTGKLRYSAGYDGLVGAAMPPLPAAAVDTDG